MTRKKMNFRERLHPDRKAAQDAYEKALKEWHKVSFGSDAAAFDKADKERLAACEALVEQEAKHPTRQEQRNKARRIRLSSRGLD